MANSLTAFNPEYWSNEMQVIFFKENQALRLANMELRELLSDGDTVNKPYRSHPQAVDYVKGTDIVVKDRSATNEQLTVSTAKVVPFYVDDIDKIQNKWETAAKFAQDAQRLLNNILEQAHNSQYSNANSTVDDGDIGGTDGNGIVVSVSNVSKMFTAAARKLDVKNIPVAKRFAIIGSRTLEKLRLYLAGKETAFGDEVGEDGRVMRRFGFEIFYSNNVPFTATLELATNPTTTDTIVINGATLTWKTSIGTAGDVLLDNSDVDVSRAAMVAAINDAGTVDTTYTQLSDDDRWALTEAGIVATNDNSNDEMTIVGYGDIVLSETLTDNTDVWNDEMEHSLFGMKGAVDMVVQKAPNVEFRLAEKRLGRYVYPWMLYGIKTFQDMKNALVDVQVDASSWS